MTEVVVGERQTTEIGEDLLAYWGDIGLYIIQKNSQVILSKEEAQNLMNYLEGKRPKLVWE